MKNLFENKWAGRALVLLVSVFGYSLSVAPTLSLWDCGEFIASIHIQGIPHPPGTPFYMILGKAWSQLLFFIPHVAFRINLLSVASSVIACLLLFEIAWMAAEKLNIRPVLRGPCAIMAGTLLAFSETFWFNAVEAEVYAFAVAEILLGLWIVLKWDVAGAKKYSPLIVLFIYVSFLGIGVHMYSMLLVPFLLYFIGLRTGRIVPGKYFYLLSGVITLSFIACFVFPRLTGFSPFILLTSILSLFFLGAAIWRGEIKDVSFWTLGLLLCTVISLTKPVMISIVFLLSVLSILSLLYNRSSLWTWVSSGVSAFLAFALYKWVPMEGQFTPISNNLDTWAGLILAGATAVYSFKEYRLNTSEAIRKTAFYSLILVMAVAGYSTHIYIPIRSQLNPAIDQNDPEDWQRLQNFIERKQYGSESMLERMFYRRGTWSGQLGSGHHMGFFKYHSSQYWPSPLHTQSWGLKWHSLGAALVMILALWACFENIRRHRQWMGLFLFIYLVCSAGLILYMNFADGHRIEVAELKYWQQSAGQAQAMLQTKGIHLNLPDPNLVNDAKRMLQITPSSRERILNSTEGGHLQQWEAFTSACQTQGIRAPGLPGPVHAEVRDRDYFFAPAFVFFTLLLALGAFLTLDSAWAAWPRGARVFYYSGLAAGVLLWLLPFLTHYKTHTRRFDYIASDFAYNLLQSCPANAILFTNGDNDTFPLWYLQEVEKVRTDISIINFSLANTNWYAKQFINQKPPVRFLSLARTGEFPDPRYIHFKNEQRIPLPQDSTIAFRLGGKGVSMVIRVQHHVLIDVVMSNYPHRPICFTLSTPPSASIGLEHNFQTVGLVNVLSPRPGLNTAAFDRNVLEKYRYRGIGDKRHIMGETAMGMTNNYRHLFNIRQQSFRMRQMQPQGTPPEFLAREKEIMVQYEELEKKLFGGGR